ncbi:MAG: tautomerase family protein [Paracoccus sp. (in: a-proteobacteria)]|nr:tautomerase family protein [Paracoccus sp. (in: a-proteobacteria)]
MPHIIVKLHSGRSEAEKTDLATRIARSVTEAIGSPDKAISIAIEEIAPDHWMEDVYETEIRPKLDQLYKRPGYGA